MNQGVPGPIACASNNAGRGSVDTRPGRRATRRWRGRTVALLAIVLLAVNLRPGMIVVSPLLDTVRDDLAMSPVWAGILGATPPLAFAVFGWITPAIARVTGFERAAWIALGVAGATQLVRLAVDSTLVFVVLSFVAYAAMGVGNVLLPPLTRLHFPDLVGPVTGLYIMFISIGTAAPAFLAVPITEVTNWRVSVGAWAVLALSAVAPWWKVRTSHRRPVRGVRRHPSRSLFLLRTPLGWGLTSVFAINSLNAYAMMTWLPTILVDAGISRGLAGAYLSLFASTAVPLALAVPWFTRRLKSATPLIILFAGCYAGGYAGLLLSPTEGTVFWVLMTGAGPGAFPLVMNLVNLRAATVLGTGALSGFTQGLGYLIGGLGPVVLGVLREVSGSWTSSLVFLMSVLLVQVAAAVFLVSRPGSIEDQLAKLEEAHRRRRP